MLSSRDENIYFRFPLWSKSGFHLNSGLDFRYLAIGLIFGQSNSDIPESTLCQLLRTTFFFKFIHAVLWRMWISPDPAKSHQLVTKPSVLSNERGSSAFNRMFGNGLQNWKLVCQHRNIKNSCRRQKRGEALDEMRSKVNTCF